MDRLNDLMAELTDIGCQLKDIQAGLIDFPAEFEGRPILLCWKAGEESVGHWHEVDAGFSGRRPVPHAEAQWPASATVSPVARD